MKRLFVILLLTLASGTWSQWLPVYSGDLSYNTTKVENAFDGDTLDGKYAIMHYADWTIGNKIARRVTILKYLALDTIKYEDHYTLYVHAKLPPSADFVVTMMTDSTTWSVLYTYDGFPIDNEFGDLPVDTTIVINVPAYSSMHYGKPFWRFALVRDYRNRVRASINDYYIDAIYLEVHEPIDTVVDPTDTVIVDTVFSSVKQLPRGIQERYFDILGRKDCINCIAIDSLGRKRWKK
jgi:hypothetical protein